MKLYTSDLVKTNWDFNSVHGGALRTRRMGRKKRPLGINKPIHLVFKANKNAMKGTLRSAKSFLIVNRVLRKYSHRFRVRIDKISIQKDHIHICIWLKRKSFGHFFLRVVAGQIAQQFQKQDLMRVTDTPKRAKILRKLWLYRPFTRVVRSYKAYMLLLDYIELNEKEVIGVLKYRKNRLRGLSLVDRRILLSLAEYARFLRIKPKIKRLRQETRSYTM